MLHSVIKNVNVSVNVKKCYGPRALANLDELRSHFTSHALFYFSKKFALEDEVQVC